jgi:hypothetical protein
MTTCAINSPGDVGVGEGFLTVSSEIGMQEVNTGKGDSNGG